MAELSIRSGVSRQNLTKWAKREGCPKKVAPKRERGYLYAWPQWNDWYVGERIKVALEKAKGTVVANDALARKLEAEAQLKELQLAERRGKLIELTVAQEFLEEFLGLFTSKAAGQLHRWEREIVQAKTPAQARRITDGMHRSLMEGCQALAEELDPPAKEGAA